MDRFSLKQLFLCLTLFAVGAAFSAGAFRSQVFGPISEVLLVVAFVMFGLALFVLAK